MKPLLIALSVATLTLFASVPAPAQTTGSSVPPAGGCEPIAAEDQYCQGPPIPAPEIGEQCDSCEPVDIAKDAAEDSLTASTALNDTPDRDGGSEEGVALAAEPTPPASGSAADETSDASAAVRSEGEPAEGEPATEMAASESRDVGSEEAAASESRDVGSEEAAASGQQGGSGAATALPDTGGPSPVPVVMVLVAAGLLVHAMVRWALDP